MVLCCFLEQRTASCFHDITVLINVVCSYAVSCNAVDRIQRVEQRSVLQTSACCSIAQRTVPCVLANHLLVFSAYHPLCSVISLRVIHIVLLINHQLFLQLLNIHLRRHLKPLYLMFFHMPQ